MEYGLNKQVRASRGRVLALVFFLGVLLGIFIGYSIGHDGRDIRLDDRPDTPEFQKEIQ